MERAEAAGWLHDVSAVVPARERMEVVDRLGVVVIPEERDYPPIVHQKLSVVLAEHLFGVKDRSVLGAIGCHTTLRLGAGDVDKVLFVADKVEWDGADRSPFRDGMLRALDISLDEACRFYLHRLWERRRELAVLHPWASSAHRDLCGCSAFGPRDNEA